MCDQRQAGSLTQDQFVLAMHLISQKVKGVELPAQVTAEMISASSYDSGFGVSDLDTCLTFFLYNFIVLFICIYRVQTKSFDNFKMRYFHK